MDFLDIFVLSAISCGTIKRRQLQACYVAFSQLLIARWSCQAGIKEMTSRVSVTESSRLSLEEQQHGDTVRHPEHRAPSRPYLVLVSSATWDQLDEAGKMPGFWKYGVTCEAPSYLSSTQPNGSPSTCPSLETSATFLNYISVRKTLSETGRRGTWNAKLSRAPKKHKSLKSTGVWCNEHSL